MKKITKLRIERTVCTTIELSQADLRALLVKEGLITRDDQSVITFSVQVPGGGDYSNERLEVGHDIPLCVEIVRQELTEQQG